MKKNIISFLLALIVILAGCEMGDEKANSNAFSEGKKIKLIEITPAEQEEIEKPRLEEENILLKEEEVILSNLTREAREGLQLFFKKDNFIIFRDASTSEILKYNLDDNKLEKLFDVNKEERLLIESSVDEGKFYLATEKKLYIYGIDGKLVEEKQFPVGLTIADIDSSKVILHSKEGIEYYSLEKEEVLFTLEGNYLGKMDNYIVLKKEENLHFIDPELHTITTVTNPSKLQPIIRRNTPLLIIPKDTGLVYFKAQQDE